MPEFTVEYEITVKGSKVYHTKTEDEASDKFYEEWNNTSAVKFIDAAVKDNTADADNVEIYEILCEGCEDEPPEEEEDEQG